MLVPLFGSYLYTYKVTLLICSHHVYDTSYLLVPLLDIAMPLERLCICKGVCCLVCWNTCIFFTYRYPLLHACTATFPILLYPYVKVNTYLFIMCLLSVNAYTHICVNVSTIFTSSKCLLPVCGANCLTP